MTFWDASALVPVYVSEPRSGEMRTLLESPDAHAVWWGTHTEVISALRAKTRAKSLTKKNADNVIGTFTEELTARFHEVPSSDVVRTVAADLLTRHPLSAADALQLAAFLSVGAETFVCLDRRLRDAAFTEGAVVLPLAV